MYEKRSQITQDNIASAFLVKMFKVTLYNMQYIWYLVSRVDQIKYDLEELPVHGELVNRLHMSKVPYRKRREEGITGPLEVVLCQYKPYP